MDAAADHPTTLAQRSQGGRHQRADRREYDGGVELLGRSLGRITGPHRTKPTGEILSCDVAGSSEREQAPALVDRDLGDDVGRRTEAVETEAFDVIPAEPQRAVADEAGAEQRGGFHIAEPIG